MSVAVWLLLGAVAAGSVVQDAPQFRAGVPGLRLEVELTSLHQIDLNRLSAEAFSIRIGNVRPVVAAAEVAKYDAKNIRFRCPDGSCSGSRFQRSATYVLAVDATDLPRDGRSRDIKVTVTTDCKTCSTKATVKPKSVRIARD